MSGYPDPFLLAGAFAVIGFVPVLALVATSYLKILVVLGLVRNAIGVQQVPPNMVLAAVAIIMTVYIMAPVGAAAGRAIETSGILEGRVNPKTLATVADAVRKPLGEFMLKHTLPEDRLFFVDSSRALWGERAAIDVNETSLIVLAPAFTLREVTRAFQIGFILYLAFLAVDLVIAAIAQALGLNMLSPTPIAIPFKLLLFVAFDGWQRILELLVLGYA
jgi:type III secretion protein R